VFFQQDLPYQLLLALLRKLLAIAGTNPSSSTHVAQLTMFQSKIKGRKQIDTNTATRETCGQNETPSSYRNWFKLMTP
jgi:hypothetical protein